ncbi:PREDICTED: uncharacterized protein LOC108774855 [Cyphomyrmex costatus]|uniref:PID domain-containing protein n=1 Tax=Cyphomyrmex costatus TaxID=456900 RepID=A0A195CM49_9HYME|nr:PREDICTED: uncharacterized protein LOC108774855 [Cyphomyrmex costatus]KYN01783.1 hypothetical protein ALC62_07463 [Cyphomyrmex costatus]
MSTLGISHYEDGFRLGGPPSECSLRSKAQIDALFEDSRSICSSMLGGWYAGLSVVIPSNHNDANEEQKRVNSAVHARIEAMFASVEAESGTPGECAAAILPVKYMGAAPVGGRVASVRGLQEPLRQLLERIEGCVRAELEVSRRGLTFRTSEVCEKNNPFRRIAVWSALRLRCKRIPSGDVHHAFLPLVGDQDQGQTMEDKHADLYRTMRGLKNEVEFYPPIFAVVMRRPGAARLLECHAFACECEEDAIAAAATLYRALLADLDANRRRPRHTNGVGCVSLASVVSSVREPSLSSRISCMLPPPPRPTAPHPVRPPRTKKTSVSSSVTEDEGGKPSLQKIPRRKKKNSDVKAEDILEARGRRRDNAKNEKSNLGPNNRDIILFRNEELQNSKNKMFSAKDQNSLRIEIESSKLDKIYSAPDDDTNGIYERQSNKYEKLHKRNNLRRESADTKDNIYGRNYGSYDLNRANARNCELYSSGTDSVLIYDKVNKIERKNEINSAYEIVGKKKEKKIYTPQIEDPDKIYSLGTEDIYTGKNNRNSQTRCCQEDIFFAKNMKNNGHYQSHHEHSDGTINQQRRSRDPERTHSSKRINRTVTMDKPLRKESLEPDYLLSTSECNRPRVRRRSRAGSEPPVSHSENANRILQENALKRSQSDVDVDRGDLMTRVELPRRGSFLTSGSTRRTNNIKGGTPLGFTELFDEFRNQEGLTSVDDILAAIIDPEGMSFNDLKPLYKEFLLKLAATLTQDELYQRSASIMKRRRRPQRRRSSRRSCLLGRAIKRSVSRLKGGPTEFTSVIFPARRLNDSFGSSSSCDVRNNHRNRILASRLGRRKSSRRTSKNGIGHTTSEDSDTCRRLNRSMGATANRSSSGYVSCSECSYDSESCTCVSADKCYCSLSRRVQATPVPGNTVVCACDTDSCSESNKCYCARKPIQPTILEQLRQKGIVPSESTLSRGDSSERIRGSRLAGSHNSSRNTDLLKNRLSPACGSSDNLALDYDLFSPGRKSQQSSGSEKVLVVSARDTQGRLVYVGGAERDKKYSSRGNGRSGAHHEALSIKKSAEIAAVFAGENNRISRRASNASSTRSSISLEAGLGYLP